MTRASILVLVVCAMSHGSVSAASPSAATLTREIDRWLARVWEEADVAPQMATDAEFLRRASLDLVGHIPNVATTRAFLADTGPDKRQRLIDALLNSAEFGRHTATLWRREWIPQADTVQFARLGPKLEQWLTPEINRNRPVDEVVTELLTASDFSDRPPQAPRTSPTAFIMASDNLPENLAANTLRAFAGVSIECAQCHDHPFEKWTRRQFWQTAAFFAPPIAQDSGVMRLQLSIPGTDELVAPAVIRGPALKWPEQVQPNSGPRALAAWLTADNNPYFAAHLANVTWKHYFGCELVERQDGTLAWIGQSDARRELLALLAETFVQSEYDLKLLTRAIVLSRAYQLSSRAVANEQLASEYGAGLWEYTHPVRALTAEQLYDSLVVAGGVSSASNNREVSGIATEKEKFIHLFHSEHGRNAERSALQTLELMNGQLARRLTDPRLSPAIRAAQAPFLNNGERLEMLFLATLGRPPGEAEAESLGKHLQHARSSEQLAKAMADILWALLNTSEFGTNH